MVSTGAHPSPVLSAEFLPQTLLRAPIIQHSTVGLMLNEILQRALSTQADSPHPRNSRQQKPKPINQEHTGTETWGQVGWLESMTETRLADNYKTKVGPIGDDLASTLIHALSTPPYPDCPICFSPIHPAQPTWSCSPSTPTIVGQNEEVQYCWTTFHVKCIRSWASKSVKDIADAWRARGEQWNGDVRLSI